MLYEHITKHTKILKVDTILRRAMYSVYDGKCFYTGRHVKFTDIHIDHIIPHSIGGADCIDNYVMTCGYINLKKSNRYTKKLIAMVKELNSLLFVDKVVKEYINFSLNEDIDNGLIDITTFIKRKGFANHPKRIVFVRFASRNLAVNKISMINKQGLPSTRKKKLFVNKNQLEVLFDNYNWA